MTTLLRLIRLPNLLVVALTQWLVAQQVLGTALARHGLSSVLDSTDLALIIVATVCLTAAGYVVNDLFDYPIDLINRPNRVIVGQRMNKGTVRWVAAVFGFVGFIASLMLALQKQELDWLWLYPFFGILLALYPQHLKTRPFAGNLFIALSCAGTAGLIWLAERSTWAALAPPAKSYTAYIITLFMVYAALATWIREIVKDLEDVRGDGRMGRRTLPVVWGMRPAKHWIWALSAVLVAALLANAVLAYQQPWVMACTLGIVVWIGYLSAALARAKWTGDFHRLSQHWKFLMLGGLVLLGLFEV